MDDLQSTEDWLARSLTRRSALRAAGTLALGFLAGGCATSARPTTNTGASVPARPFRRLVPVDVAEDRVIRTVVGLRPFRRSGFLVRADRIGDKTIVHNYGHGGCGVTLSWGSAHLAVEEAMKTGAREFAVLGCGAVGLATALLLQRRGLGVTIYARDLPPDTTSNIAGATFHPSFTAYSAERTSAFEEQFERAARLSHRAFQNLLGPRYGVRWIEQYWLSDKPIQWHWDRLRIADLFPTTRMLEPGEHPFDAPHAAHDATMIIEPSIYLNAILQDYRIAGGRVVPVEFSALEQVLALREPAVINCTGLGAKALFGDDELQPIKGQLTVLLPQPEIDYVLMAQNGLYMFPRTDGILLGGTFEGGVWDLAPNQEAAQRVLAGHDRIFERMRAR